MRILHFTHIFNYKWNYLNVIRHSIPSATPIIYNYILSPQRCREVCFNVHIVYLHICYILYIHNIHKGNVTVCVVEIIYLWSVLLLFLSAIPIRLVLIPILLVYPRLKCHRKFSNYLSYINRAVNAYKCVASTN